MDKYQGPQNNLRNRYAQPSLPMDDLPYKTGLSLHEIEIAELKQELAKEKARNAMPKPKHPPTARQTTAQRRKPSTSRARQSQSAKSTARPKKALPPMRTPGEQPRDNLGRFASKIWQGTKATARGTVKAVRGTVKTARRAHKAVKRANADIRRRDRLALRERALKIKEREARFNGKRRKAGKSTGKQGLLSRLIFGRRKR